MTGVLRNTAAAAVFGELVALLRNRPILAASGLGLLVLNNAVVLVSPHFVYGSPMEQRPILLAVSLLMAAGAVYVFAMLSRQTAAPPSRALFLWIAIIGLAMRGAMSLSTPILEDDFYRYLWDGAVLAQGYNPYASIPRDVADGALDTPQALLELANNSGLVIERVNHAWLGTIYPPVAITSFALAHWIAPWSLAGLRAVFFLADVATALLLIRLLDRLGKPRAWAAVWWWNPLLVKETYNSVHMDVIVAPFVVLAMLLALDRRALWAGVVLACATAAKLWPLLLVPALVWPIRTHPRRVLRFGAAFGVAAIALLAPIYTALQHGEDSGFRAYGERWEMNDALFMVFTSGIRFGMDGLGFEEDKAVVYRGARLAALACVAGTTLLALAFAYRRESRVAPGNSVDSDGRRHAVLIGTTTVATLFLVSPTQFPWYFVWLLPFLALTVSPALLLLTVMLPIYYLKFYFAARDNVMTFHNGVVWFEYAPVWLALVWEGWRQWRRRNADQSGTRTASAVHGSASVSSSA